VSLTVANPPQRLLWQLLESETRTRFSRWMTKYSKTYRSEEEKESGSRSFGTTSTKLVLFVGQNKIHVANDDIDVIFRFLSFFLSI
jgi:hypothetical protein